MPVFIFDLDGTLTAAETLPVIAKHFGVEHEIYELTQKTVQGSLPFIESFMTRVEILGTLPVDEVADVLEQVPLHGAVQAFIAQHQAQCVIATGNLDCWIHKLAGSIECTCYQSTALVKNNQVEKIETILCKEQVVEQYKKAGKIVVFIGDGHNDLEAMRLADISIACGIVHPPASSIVAIADHVVDTEEYLCQLLNQLLLTAPEQFCS